MSSRFQLSGASKNAERAVTRSSAMARGSACVWRSCALLGAGVIASHRVQFGSIDPDCRVHPCAREV